jgi:acyl carrier protein
VSAFDDRLGRCFRATFPELGVDAVASASTDTLAAWDSLHTVILIAVVEEAFGVRIPARDYPAMRSYDAVAAYLRSARAG